MLGSPWCGTVDGMTADTGLVTAGVARYAARLHAVAGARHHVASPLGAWLLLALAGPASSGTDRDALTEVLGCDVASAASMAASLLADPHPLVAGAAAVWTAPGFADTAEFRRWLNGLPAVVSTGELPGQPGLDAWARQHTFGLIETFPLDADQAVLVLATALATRVSWEQPFELAPADALGSSSPWARELGHVLRTPNGPGVRGHVQFIAPTPDDGDVIVHGGTAVGGLLVVSVAARPEVPAGRVLAIAYDIGHRLAVGAPVARRDLASLPLGDGPLWGLREVMAPADSCSAVLPAWSASSRQDLTDPTLGFAAAVRGLVPGAEQWDARQAAMARYSRTGFEAAATTAMAARVAARVPAPHRVAELRFASPYAVVAVATEPATGGYRPPAAVSPWSGLPVFSAWVCQPDDTDTDDPGPAGIPL
jgi:hypothetical protein